MNQDEMFTSLVKNVIPDRIISHFIVIAEVTESDGKSLHVVMSDGMTRWLAEGMVNSASDTMFASSYQEEDD